MSQAPIAPMQATAKETPKAHSADGIDMTANEMNLREQLLQAAADQSSAQSPNQSPPLSSAHARPDIADAHTSHIDPAIAATYELNQTEESGGTGVGDSPGTMDAAGRRSARRELSTTKRAAQNRAAQRAFRQRKEGYIRKLEDQVRGSGFPPGAEDVHRSETENMQLREYIATLQICLLEAQGSYPPPESHLDIRDPRSLKSLPPPPPPSSEGMGVTAISQLQAAAVAAQAEDYEDPRRQQEEDNRYERSSYPPIPRPRGMPKEE